MHRSISRLILISLLAAASEARASNMDLSSQGGAGVATEIAENAMAKGYGTTCSLSMIPVDSGGYYPCIDFGPYRYVHEYQKISAYVLVKDAPPFKIMGGTLAEPRFIVGGPWESDLPRRAVEYWNDIIEGGAQKREQTDAERKAKDNAAAYIESQMPQTHKPDATSANTPDDTRHTETQPEISKDAVTEDSNASTTNIKKVLTQSR